jgi:hypothetical protein
MRDPRTNFGDLYAAEEAVEKRYALRALICRLVNEVDGTPDAVGGDRARDGGEGVAQTAGSGESGAHDPSASNATGEAWQPGKIGEGELAIVFELAFGGPVFQTVLDVYLIIGTAGKLEGTAPGFVPAKLISCEDMNSVAFKCKNG